MTVAYLALGANLGDRARTIERALEELAGLGISIAAVSALYETDAVTPDPQPPYLNAVERALGRVRPPGRVAAARFIDIDLLLYGDAVIAEPPALVVPHPRLLQRP